jgi:hypothetical protein
VVTTPLPVPAAAPTTLETPGWLLPVLVASGAAVLLIIIAVIIGAFIRRRETTTPAFNPANKINGNSHSHRHRAEDEHKD